jgi:hypothetical protein
LYFVPSRTLSGGEARALGIRGEEDTKAIAHPLPGRAAFRPSGWREAARLLLANGPVRLKRGRGIEGRGQAVIEALDDPVFDALDETELGTYGLVVEPNLADLATFSVGQVCVGALRASYCGTQKTTRDNQGELVYGGSDVLVMLGGFDDLERLDVPPQVREAVARAKAFDAAAEEFDGLFASRRNYDVLRGRDRQGRWYSGVLEQSWRIGGASGPDRSLRRGCVGSGGRYRPFPRCRSPRRRDHQIHARGTV